MKRRAIAILALSLWARTPVAAQTAPVINGQNGTVTISAQTLDWFRQRLAEEEERLRQLQITVQQIARALANSPGAAQSLSTTPAQPATATAPSILDPAAATAWPATAGPAVTATPSTATPAPSAAATPKPGAPSKTPGPRIAIPMWTPATPNAPPTAAQPAGPDVSGSPVPIAPGADDAAPAGEIEVPGALEGAEARVTTDPAVLPLAAPLRPGLTQEQVRQVKGTPALISRNEQAGIETWSYPDGSITFQGGRLTTWKLQSVAPPMEPVARRAPRTTPAEERMAMGATDIEIPEAAAPPKPEPAEKIVPEEKSVEKVAQLRTTTRTTTKKVRRGHHRSHRWAWHHRRHHRFAWGRHRSHRYASTRYRRHHRWAKGTVRTTGRHASAVTHCRLCQMARAHLRSGHRVVMSEVAGWRARSGKNATAKVRLQQRKAMVLQRR